METAIVVIKLLLLFGYMLFMFFVVSRRLREQDQQSTPYEQSLGNTDQLGHRAAKKLSEKEELWAHRALSEQRRRSVEGHWRKKRVFNAYERGLLDGRIMEYNMLTAITLFRCQYRLNDCTTKDEVVRLLTALYDEFGINKPMSVTVDDSTIYNGLFCKLKIDFNAYGKTASYRPRP